MLKKTALLCAVLSAFSFVRAQNSSQTYPGDQTALLFVSAKDGNDNWSGRLPWPNWNKTDGPLASLDGARNAVRTLDRSGLRQIDVLFFGGRYALSQPVTFDHMDSGTPDTKMVYENFPGESPVFSGGVRVTGWKYVGDDRWESTLPPGVKPFEDLYYNGVRHLRPRVGGYLGQYFRTFKTVYVDSAELPGCPHRDTDPTSPHFKQYECFDRFDYDPAPDDKNNPYANPWSNLAPPPGNPCKQPVGNPALWGDIEILVFEQFSTSKLHVSCVDTEKNRVYLTGPTAAPPLPHATETGFIETDRYIVENVKNALTKPGQWYLDRRKMVLTYLAESGEDPNGDEVFVPQVPQLLIAHDLQYVTFRGLTFEHDNYTLPFPTGHASTELETDIAAAVSFQNSSYITFDFGTLREIAGTGLDFISCITPSDSSNAPLPECVTTTTNPVVSNNAITNSAFFDIGALGIRIGGHYLSTNEDGNVPQWTKVENNVVEGYGRTIPASFGIGQGYGHDNTYSHNDVYDGYHCAISLSTNAGDTQKPNGIGVANNTISFNHVYNLLQGIMNDGGSIRVDGGNAAYTAPGNRVLNNKIHDVTDASIMDSNGYGGHGVYMDNQTGLVDVENNLVYRVSDATIYTPHGPSPKPPDYPNEANLIKNNILAYGRLGIVEEGDPYQYPVPKVPRKVPQSFVISNNIFYFDRDLTSTSPFHGVAASAPFNVNTGCTYTPFAYPLYQEWTSNLYWRTDGKFSNYAAAFNVQTTKLMKGQNAPCAGSRIAHHEFYTFYDFRDWMNTVGEDAGSVVKNPHFANPVYPADDYSLWGWGLNISFVPFDPDEAGRYRYGFRIEPPLVPATFVTETYNPLTDY